MKQTKDPKIVIWELKEWLKKRREEKGEEE